MSVSATGREEPTAAPAARVIGDAARVLPQASGILTSGSMAGATEPEPLARFLAEELAIGDAEDAVAALRAQLSDPSALPADEYEMLFQTVTAMQKDLTRRRLAHKAV